MDQCSYHFKVAKYQFTFLSGSKFDIFIPKNNFSTFNFWWPFKLQNLIKCFKSIYLPGRNDPSLTKFLKPKKVHSNLENSFKIDIFCIFIMVVYFTKSNYQRWKKILSIKIWAETAHHCVEAFICNPRHTHRQHHW